MNTADKAGEMHEHVHNVHQDAEGDEHVRGVPRRDFLKLTGFTLAALAVGCEQPANNKILPHVAMEPEVTPGTSSWYAGTCAACNAGCGILVRNRDNRPVKVEGLPEHPVSKGGLCAAGQASLLSLYDSHRLGSPLRKGGNVTWQQLDMELLKEFDRLRQSSARVRVLSGSVTSPSLQRAIDAFLSTFANGRHVMYDAVSASAMLDAHQEAFGSRLLPRFHIGKARAIVSFDADFLGTWISPVEFSAAWISGRKVDEQATRVSWHAQIEAHMSLSGTKSDYRLALGGDERYALLLHLQHRIARLAGESAPAAQRKLPVPEATLGLLTDKLWEARGSALLLCGTNDRPSQRVALHINAMLGSYGETIDITSPSMQKQGSDYELHVLVEELRRGEVDVLLLLNVNPVYDAPDAWKLGELISRVPLSIHCASHADETARHAHYVCPTPHFLEEWSDARPVAGLYTLSQPMIPPTPDRRPVIESLSLWNGRLAGAYELIREYWRERVFPRSGSADFEAWWSATLATGSAQITEALAVRQNPATSAAPATDSHTDVENEGLELVLYPRVGMPDGTACGNAWLLELPDPITKCSWENVASVSKKTAAMYQLKQGDVVRISELGAGGASVELPVLVQEGQADGTLAVATGYGALAGRRFAQPHVSWWFGRPNTGPEGDVGARVSGLRRFSDGTLRSERISTKLAGTGKHEDLALAQEYQYLAVPGPDGDGSGKQRPCVQEASLAQLASGSLPHAHAHELHSMWKEHEYNGHHWGMTIDINACTGCSACVIGCQVENNIPVVGRDEVRRNRDMHWLRIDRYYFHDNSGDLRVAHQPMLCHHCDNAPCETVCPVLATVHSSEGLNQQVYNRCVGTRYCSNNCPYKVRRFNWFNYARDEEENLVLNPDVTVRTRGVMEKCSFCVQRIQEAKIVAKGEGRAPVDGEIQPACMQSCPTRAIRFGDMNDSDSSVSREMRNPRHYRVLEELGVKPSVGYLMQVRNTATPDKEKGNG
jgi:Fe-S-cluster-containing dehydrogenase component